MTAKRLENFWHPIARSVEVGEQPRQFRPLGEKLVAFRHEGAVSVFDDLCIHRGTALALGSVDGGRITCPCHGWTYDCTGAGVHIPSLLEGAPNPRKARAIGKSVKACRWR